MAVTYFVRMRAREGREEAVRDLLLSNVARIDAGERGNVVFAVHASTQDPREFWLYETWTDPDAVLYTPLAWPVRGRHELKAFVAQFHVANPGLRVTLHDEFASADATRACFRFVIHFHNTGPFYGHAPTGEQGTMSETHAVRLRDGRIVEQFVGDNNFSMPHQELVTWGIDFPRDTPDPSPVLAEAAAEAQPTM
jgi:hypothetical protein